MASILTHCINQCLGAQGSTRGLVTDDELQQLLDGTPLNKGPWASFDRYQVQTLKCGLCDGPMEITLRRGRP